MASTTVGNNLMKTTQKTIADQVTCFCLI